MLDELGALAREHDLWLVSDEVYADLVYDGEHASALAIRGCEERVAVVGSLSKSHAMTGFRHGWMVGPEELVDHVDALLQSMLFGSPPFVQDAGLAALRARRARSPRCAPPTPAARGSSSTRSARCRASRRTSPRPACS